MSGCGGPIPAQSPVPRVQVPAAVTVGKHEIDGWKVAVLPLRSDGHPEGTPLVMNPEQAAELGRQLIEMAEVCDGRWGE